jgi:hypothetical protein
LILSSSTIEDLPRLGRKLREMAELPRIAWHGRLRPLDAHELPGTNETPIFRSVLRLSIAIADG